MNGARFCRRLLECRGIEARVVCGTCDCYLPRERVLVLRASSYHGATLRDLTLVAHEVGHAEQELRLGWMTLALRWVFPVRLWLEWDACRRARRFMAEEGMKAEEAVLREIWRGYLGPALWQFGWMVGVLGVAGWRLWR